VFQVYASLIKLFPSFLRNSALRSPFRPFCQLSETLSDQTFICVMVVLQALLSYSLAWA